MCQRQQYAMETERTQCQLCTSNKARNLHQWFSAFCILHPSAAETPASLRLDYTPDSKLDETYRHTSFKARLTAYIRGSANVKVFTTWMCDHQRKLFTFTVIA